MPEPTDKRQEDQVLSKTFNWYGEPEVFRFLIDVGRLTEALRKNASKPYEDPDLRKCAEATSTMLRSQKKCSRKAAQQVVAEGHVQGALEAIRMHFLNLLAEDAADLLSLCLGAAIDATAVASGVPRAKRENYVNVMLRKRRERVSRLFKSGRLLGQTARRRLSEREQKNKKDRMMKTIKAIRVTEQDKDMSLSRTSIARQIGISSKQFREEWLPDLLSQSNSDSWDEFISVKKRLELKRRFPEYFKKVHG